MIFEARTYHYLVAGLPTISFDNLNHSISPIELKEILKQEFHDSDYYQLEMLLYPYDHSRIVRFLQGIENDEEGLANYSLENFKDQQELFSAIVPAENVLPDYMADIMQNYLNTPLSFDSIRCRKDLDSAYQKHIEVVGSRFLREYTQFEYDLSNLLTFLKAAKLEMDPADYVTGKSPFANYLMQTKRNSIILYPEFEYFNKIVSIEKSLSYALAELEYDKLRWQVIEHITLFEDFTADAVLGYFAKLLIADRWAVMNESSGKERLLEAVDKALMEKTPEDYQ